MPTFILVLQNDQNKSPWLARKWGADPAKLSPDCTFNSGVNQLFPKSFGDKVSPGPCAVLTDENGNRANAVMVQLFNSGL
ncbi:MAG: hypothetical protein JWR12_2996 [Mucilaginibacter sp.]|nr:hypothetical protein [Mucilaginibacter sp.]